MRSVLLPGEELPIAIVKEGKEAGQGVGYLPDGTMVIIESGRKHIGETLDIVVTSALQTSAGRLVFAKIRQARRISPTRDLVGKACFSRMTIGYRKNATKISLTRVCAVHYNT
ncbi:hypothetical protein SDC9_88635 [bioreactor metagenome]|uniref:TRAM domain-containing protein n=1 Tax=bioreactor metagenome TaxID=1076179 RepID=A0A644ZTK1_9ZZZZ